MSGRGYGGVHTRGLGLTFLTSTMLTAGQSASDSAGMNINEGRDSAEYELLRHTENPDKGLFHSFTVFQLHIQPQVHTVHDRPIVSNLLLATSSPYLHTETMCRYTCSYGTLRIGSARLCLSWFPALGDLSVFSGTQW